MTFARDHAILSAIVEGEQMTAVAKRFGISRQRVQQIRDRAMERGEMPPLLDARDVAELRWLAKQHRPVWGAHLERGDPPHWRIARMLRLGFIEQTPRGYHISPSGIDATHGVYARPAA